MFASSAALILAFLAAGQPVSLFSAPLIAGLVILALGVPHGAFDVALARDRWQLTTPVSLAGFLVRYLGLAAATIAVWLLVPELALPVFIAVSGYHFAGDWDDELETLPRTVLGLAIITAPALFHREAVTEIFAWLVPQPVALTKSLVMAVASLPLLQAAILIVIVTTMRQKLRAAIEMMAVLLLAVFSSPLVFFVVYFCGVHSVRHLESVYRELRPRSLREFAKWSMPFAPLAIIGIGAAAILLPVIDPGQALLTVLFITLAALTVPHMALVEGPGAQRSVSDNGRQL